MSLAIAQTLPDPSRRLYARSNTFLMAMLVSDTLSAPVRIKNLSATGALLNGRELPRLNETCRLRRADISVSGQIVRMTPRGAAIQFARQIDVAQWIGAPQQLQSEVDRKVHDARHRYPVADSNHLVAAARQMPAQLGPARVSREEMLDLADQLDRLANALSEDPVVIAKHYQRLQILDIASQRLRVLHHQ